MGAKRTTNVSLGVGGLGGAHMGRSTDNASLAGGGVWTIVPMETVLFDHGDVFGNTSTGRIEVATSGLYVVGGSLGTGSSTSPAQAYVAVSVNGGSTGEVDRFNLSRQVMGASEAAGATRLLTLNAGDDLALMWFCSSSNTSRAIETWIWAAKVA